MEPDRFLRWPEVHRLVSYSRPMIDRKEAAGLFPKRIRIGTRAVAWKLSEVEAWMAAQPQAVRGVKAKGYGELASCFQ